ncbi:MAG: DMT family transporter [Candidatus Thermoplasmatota archaeon]|nr:DMT family transporter [Candidatus Thermoplasmatota archaeon]
MAARAVPGKLTLGLLVGLAILAISTAAPLIKAAQAPVLVIAFWRLCLATGLLALAAAFSAQAREDLAGLSPRDAVGLLAVGVVLALHFASWMAGLVLTSVAASVVLVTLHPVIVGLASARLFGEGLGSRAWTGVIVAFLGGIGIVWGDTTRGPEPLLGDILSFLGALAVAAYFLAGRGYRRRLSLLAYVVPVYMGATLALAALVGVTGEAFTGYATREWLIFLALAVLPMVLGHTVLNYALRYVTAPVIATSTLGEPVGSTLLALIFLGEVPPWSTVVGGVVVLVGILLVVQSREAAPGEAARLEEKTPEASDGPG